MSPSSPVMRCDSCGQEKVTVEHDGRRLCLVCLQHEKDGAPAAMAPPAETGLIQYAMESAPTTVAPSPLAGFTDYPIGGTTTVAASPGPARVTSMAPAQPHGSGFVEHPVDAERTRQDVQDIPRPRRGRRARRRQKWLILGAIGLSVGGALLAIVLTQGTSGLVRFFTVPSLEAPSGRKYTPAGAAKRYIEKLSEDGSKK